MAAPPNELFIVLSGFGFFFCAIPFWWHLQSWNVGTCLFMFWTGVGSLNYMINAIIWNHNVANIAPVWCDISTRFIVGLNTGLPAAVLVIMLRLWKIASLRSAQITQAEKRRDMTIDISLGLGMPILAMGLQVIVQSNRFNIWEDVGCFWNTYPTWVSWLIVYPWPFIISLFSWVFGSLAYYHLRNRAVQFAEFASSNAKLNQGRYMRLMFMTSIVLTISFVDSIQVIYQNARTPLFPWISWADTHADFGFVGQTLRKDTPSAAVVTLELQRWMPVISSFVFFAFFGFADEARLHYRKVYSSLAQTVNFSHSTASPSSSSFGNMHASQLNVSVNKESYRYPPMTATASLASVAASRFTRSKRETMESFFDTLSLKDSARADSPTLPEDEVHNDTNALAYPPGLGLTPQSLHISLAASSEYPPTPSSPAHHHSFLMAETPAEHKSFLSPETPIAHKSFLETVTPPSSAPVPESPAPRTPATPMLHAAPAGRHVDAILDADTDKPLPPPPRFLGVDPNAAPRHRADTPRSAKTYSTWSEDPTVTRSDAGTESFGTIV
ncbi:STE3-domain-containing protein [Peniophora sp. CONT]|nr:STE3-domain-containing protein [Peniophora sp. CONT]